MTPDECRTYTLVSLSLDADLERDRAELLRRHATRLRAAGRAREAVDFERAAASSIADARRSLETLDRLARSDAGHGGHVPSVATAAAARESGR